MARVHVFIILNNIKFNSPFPTRTKRIIFCRVNEYVATSNEEEMMGVGDTSVKYIPMCRYFIILCATFIAVEYVWGTKRETQCDTRICRRNDE